MFCELRGILREVRVPEDRVERAGRVLDEKIYRRLPVVERNARTLFQLSAILVFVEVMLLPEKKQKIRGQTTDEQSLEMQGF